MKGRIFALLLAIFLFFDCTPALSQRMSDYIYDPAAREAIQGMEKRQDREDAARDAREKDYQRQREARQEAMDEHRKEASYASAKAKRRAKVKRLRGKQSAKAVKVKP